MTHRLDHGFDRGDLHVQDLRRLVERGHALGLGGGVLQSGPGHDTHPLRSPGLSICPHPLSCRRGHDHRETRVDSRSHRVPGQADQVGRGDYDGLGSLSDERFEKVSGQLQDHLIHVGRVIQIASPKHEVAAEPGKQMMGEESHLSDLPQFDALGSCRADQLPEGAIRHVVDVEHRPRAERLYHLLDPL